MTNPVKEYDIIYNLLEKKYREYNSSAFIEHDPIAIPHSFSKKQDVEISAFWTAVLSWGNRKSILASSQKLMALMDRAPHDFILHHQNSDLGRLLRFKHRT